MSRARSRATRRRLAAAAALAALGLALLSGQLGSQERMLGERASVRQPTELDRCLTSARIDALRAGPERARILYRRCAAGARAAVRELGISVDEDRAKAVFASAAAHRFAPYGSSRQLSYAGLARAKGLDCAKYALLAFRLYRGAGGADELEFVGWEGGAIGNHAQLWLGGTLLDPTTGVVAQAPLSRVLAGAPAPGAIDVSATPVPGDLKGRVLRALAEGSFRQQDLLYWARTPGAFIEAGRLVDLEGQLRFDGLGPGLVAIRAPLAGDGAGR